jgi:hypothetical protein
MTDPSLTAIVVTGDFKSKGKRSTGEPYLCHMYNRGSLGAISIRGFNVSDGVGCGPVGSMGSRMIRWDPLGSSGDPLEIRAE